jgi:hypothetical protein
MVGSGVITTSGIGGREGAGVGTSVGLQTSMYLQSAALPIPPFVVASASQHSRKVS